MFSGRRTGMRALVWRLYIPVGPLATAPLILPCALTVTGMPGPTADLKWIDVSQPRSARPVVDDCNVYREGGSQQRL
jgi:hypothetical protein